ncbi:MAG TPA: crotonase/enoyl-CoA hydratase family protein [Thermoanaerobaculia bacterium]|nr:crotonase/enoyl-CoA hydratase family protein [Thermoanaerobaculia bacterium]
MSEPAAAGGPPAAGRVTSERRGDLLLIGLDRPAKRNALTPEMLHGLAAAYGELERGDARCGVLFAHGQDFTTGLDLLAMAPVMTQERWTPHPDSIDPWGLTPPDRTKPVVAAVHGRCWTAGLELALAADLVVAAAGTRFAQLEVQRGLVPLGGGAWRLVERAGWGNAMRYLLTGDELDAAEAYRLGVVQEVVADGRQLDRALELAAAVAEQAPLGVRTTRELALLAGREGPAAAAAALDARRLALVASADAAEGVASLIERRKPRFTGT